MSSAQLYDTIGATYTVTRRTEPRIAAQVWAALGNARTVLNVGAGTGSCSPPTVTSPRWNRRRSCVRSVPRARRRAWLLRGEPSVRGPVLRRRDGFCHRSSLAGPGCGSARDAARGSPRGGLHARHLWNRLASSVLADPRLPPEVADLVVCRPRRPSWPARSEPGWSRCFSVGLRRRLLRGLLAPTEASLDEDVRRGISVWARVGPVAEQRAVRSLREDLVSVAGPNGTATSSVSRQQSLAFACWSPEPPAPAVLMASSAPLLSSHSRWC